MANRGNTIRCTIVDEQENILGLISLTGIDHINQSGELHIMIGDKKNQGKGAGTYAVHAILAHAFYNMNLQRVELTVLEENLPARRLYEKAGFVQEGIKRKAVYKEGVYKDMLQYSILRDEYNPHETNWGGVKSVLPDYSLARLNCPSDMESVIRLCDSAFKRPVLKMAEYETLFQKWNTSGDFLVAYNGNVCGYAILYANDLSTRGAYLTMLAVRPEYQNKHVGHFLLHACEEIAAERGMAEMKLEVWNDNAKAICFYNRNGYTKIGNGGSESFHMVKKLPCMEH